jgi:hypothetical protein
MIELMILLVLVLAVLIAAIYVLGFRLGREDQPPTWTQIRLESAQASRRLHDVDRAAFDAMVNRVMGQDTDNNAETGDDEAR